MVATSASSRMIERAKVQALHLKNLSLVYTSGILGEFGTAKFLDSVLVDTDRYSMKRSMLQLATIY
tara:strand:- start:1082 stop:1279 length:198 start_codon:yes stop_codon:yes gene_type:complete